MKQKLYLAGGFLLGAFYILAGLNHFRIPDFYTGIMPPYFPAKDILNLASGLAEILLGAAVLYRKTSRIATYLIIAMLIAFIPVHIYFIQVDSCIKDVLCKPPWVGWVRLVIVHPLLILWAWSYRSFGSRPA